MMNAVPRKAPAAERADLLKKVERRIAIAAQSGQAHDRFAAEHALARYRRWHVNNHLVVHMSRRLDGTIGDLIAAHRKARARRTALSALLGALAAVIVGVVILSFVG